MQRSSTKCQLALRFQCIGKRKISCVICKVCAICGFVSPSGPSQVRLISRMARFLDLRKHNEIICSADIEIVKSHAHTVVAENVY